MNLFDYFVDTIQLWHKHSTLNAISIVKTAQKKKEKKKAEWRTEYNNKSLMPKRTFPYDINYK